MSILSSIEADGFACQSFAEVTACMISTDKAAYESRDYEYCLLLSMDEPDNISVDEIDYPNGNGGAELVPTLAHRPPYNGPSTLACTSSRRVA